MWEDRNVYYAARDGWDDGRGGWPWRHASLYGGLANRVYKITMHFGRRVMLRAYKRRATHRATQRIRSGR